MNALISDYILSGWPMVSYDGKEKMLLRKWNWKDRKKKRVRNEEGEER